MKKWLWLVLVLGLILALGLPAQASTAFTTDLLDGRGRDVGDVIVSDDDVSVTVTFDTSGSAWCLEETRLDVAGSYEELPTTRWGNPIPARFDYVDSHPDCPDTFSIAVPLDGFSGTSELYIAARVKWNNHTAWAAGFAFPGNNWATYFVYSLD